MGGYILGNCQMIPGLQKAFSQRFSTREKSKHIGPKKMSAVLLALNKWHTQLGGSKLLIFGDNFGVVQGLTIFSIRVAVMSRPRKIAMMLALYDIVIESQWILTNDNWPADILSRGVKQEPKSDAQLLNLCYSGSLPNLTKKLLKERHYTRRLL